MNRLERTKYLGSTDIAAIIGASRYKTPLQVYNSKVLGIVEDENDAMYWGKVLEPHIIDKFESDKDIKVLERDVFALHEEHEFLGATADGLTDELVIEAKTSSMYKNNWDKEVPDEYMVQCQWMMGIHKRQACYFCVLFQNKETAYYLVPFDEHFFDLLVSRAVDFWYAHVIREIPPPFTTLDPEVMEFESQSVMDATVDIVDIVNTVNELKEQKAVLEDKIEALEGELKVKTAGYEVLKDGDSVLLKKTKVTSRKFDTKLLLDNLGKNYKDIFKQIEDEQEQINIKYLGENYEERLKKDVISYRMSTNFKRAKA